MDAFGWLQMVLLGVLLVFLTKPLGRYLYLIFERENRTLPLGLGYVERFFFWICGVSPKQEQNWKTYLGSVVLTSSLGVFLLFLVLIFQHKLPWNPNHVPALSYGTAWVTAVSFVTNTDWQSYVPELSMSYFSQSVGLTWQGFVSAGTGVTIACAFVRGITRRTSAVQGNQESQAPKSELGNFYVDLIRSILFVFLPISILAAIFFISQGVVQSLLPDLTIKTLEGGSQKVVHGLIASQVAIKVLGSNGGGFLSANSAHPFENPTTLTNFVQILLMLLIPAGLTYYYGLMAKDVRQGKVLWAAMMVLLLGAFTICYFYEAKPISSLPSAGVEPTIGMISGKEARFGVGGSVLFNVVATATSTGALNANLGSFHPISKLVLLLNMQIGEIIFGGVGGGLYGMLMIVLLTVFISGLMVGRTPEYLGKKIEPIDMKWFVFYIILFPMTVLISLAFVFATGAAKTTLLAITPSGFSSLLYALTSVAANNGSSITGLSMDKTGWHFVLSICMIIGRFVSMVPVLAIAGQMSTKKIVPVSLGTFPTHGALFVVLLVGISLLLGALTFFPVLCFGPIAEYLMALKGGVL